MRQTIPQAAAGLPVARSVVFTLLVCVALLSGSGRPAKAVDVDTLVDDAAQRCTALGTVKVRAAELARQGELAVVIHRLIGKAEERIPIDRCVDLLDQARGERMAEVDAADAGAELGMQHFVLYLGHAARISRMQSRMQPGTIVFNRAWTVG